MRRGLRDSFFLATKTGKRTYGEAREEFRLGEHANRQFS
jgi:hypothetical protein